MSNSKLVNYTKLSPHYTKMTNKVNKKITIHHMAGNLTVERCGEVFSGTREASSNYGIGTDGRVGLYVEEENRAWTSSNADNDNQAITIEVANDIIGGDWHVSDIALNKLIELCVDICKRNNIDRLNYTGDAKGNLTMHKYFAATTCPGPYLESKFPYITEEVNKRLVNKEVKAKTCINMTEEEIWNYLLGSGLSEAGVAGLMGNLYSESGLKANNLQNSGNKRLGLTDEQYTEKVDSGEYTKEQFIRDKIGYGLAQHTYWSRKQALYEFISSKGASIGCTKTQLDFIVQELKGYKTVYEVLKSAKSVKEASDIVLTQYEKPADQSDQVKIKRATFGENIFNKYNKKEHIDKEVNTEIRVGDIVKLKEGAKQYNGNAIRQDYIDKEYTVKEIKGTRAVLTINNSVIYAVNINNLRAIDNKVGTPVFKDYKVKILVDDLNIRKGPGIEHSIVGVIKDKGVYTIIEESGNWLRLKSKAGWIYSGYTKKL